MLGEYPPVEMLSHNCSVFSSTFPLELFWEKDMFSVGKPSSVKLKMSV